MKKGLGYLGCLFFVVGLCLTNIQPIKAQQIEIYILEDGNIEPITALIQRTGELYTLTNDVEYFIIVEKDNIILDGNGYTVSSLNLVQRTNITIKNVDSNIWLVNTSNSVIQGCQGNIRLDNCFNNNMFENNFKSNPNGILLINSNNNILHKNNITGVIQGAIGFSLVSSQNNSIYENNIIDNSVGLGLSDNSIHNSIFRNNFINNTEQAGGWDSLPNIWDDGEVGNYWSDFVDGSSYEIQIRFMEDNSVQFDYDSYPQGQPVAIPEFPTTIASITIIAIIGIGLLVYFKKQT